MWAVHHGVAVSMTTVSISSDPFSPALQVRRDHRLVGVRRGTDKARARGVPPRAQVIATGGLRRRPQAVRAPTPEGIPQMNNDFFTMGSGTPRQAWLNYHDERNMNHKQTEM